MCSCASMCSDTQTHMWARVSESTDEIYQQPASFGPVCTHRHATVSKAIPHQQKMANIYDFKGDSKVPKRLPSPSLCSRCKPHRSTTMLSQWKQNIHFTQIIIRQKTTNPCVTTNGCSTQYLGKDPALGDWGGGGAWRDLCLIVEKAARNSRL